MDVKEKGRGEKVVEEKGELEGVGCSRENGRRGEEDC